MYRTAKGVDLMEEREDMKRMKEYQRIIRKILMAFQSVSFPIIVESSTGYKVISVNKKRDSALIDDISNIADIITNRYYRSHITRDTYADIIGREPKAFRPNEVGRILEYAIYMIPKKFKAILEIQPLKQVGYPDLRIVEKTKRIAFVEIKATTRPNVGSPRDFYYSTKEKTLKKINSDGLHLLLGFIIKEVKPEEFITIGWKLVDLSKIKVSIKAEFNADNLEIYKSEAIIKEKLLEELND